MVVSFGPIASRPESISIARTSLPKPTAAGQTALGGPAVVVELSGRSADGTVLGSAGTLPGMRVKATEPEPALAAAARALEAAPPAAGAVLRPTAAVRTSGLEPTEDLAPSQRTALGLRGEPSEPEQGARRASANERLDDSRQIGRDDRSSGRRAAKAYDFTSELQPGPLLSRRPAARNAGVESQPTSPPGRTDSPSSAPRVDGAEARDSTEGPRPVVVLRAGEATPAAASRPDSTRGPRAFDFPDVTAEAGPLTNDTAPTARSSSDATSGTQDASAARTAEGRNNADRTGDAEEASEEPSRPTGPGGQPLTDEEVRQVEALEARDREVRNHEQAHKVAAGPYGGAIHYDYQTGPDAQRYAVGGHVPIDMSDIPGDPAATAQKMQVIRRAALAPSEPSAKDRQVAAEASRREAEARQDARTQQTEERAETTQSATNDRGSDSTGSPESTASESIRATPRADPPTSSNAPDESIDKTDRTAKANAATTNAGGQREPVRPVRTLSSAANEVAAASQRIQPGSNEVVRRDQLRASIRQAYIATYQ